MQPGAQVDRMLNRELPLWSIRLADATVEVFYGDGDLEVATLKLDAGATVKEPYLWSACSWHLLLEGQAIFEQGKERYSVLRGQSLFLHALPYRLTNPVPSRAKLLTLLFHFHTEGRPQPFLEGEGERK